MPSERSRVLVVEAEDVLRRFLVSLGERRYEVDSVDGGAAMRRALATGRYDVVVVNADLPDADGLALAREAEGRRCGVVVIPHREGQDGLIAQRGFRTLPKSFTDLQLLMAIEAAKNDAADRAADRLDLTGG
jgi:DNA-binding response OmpR family regulator